MKKEFNSILNDFEVAKGNWDINSNNSLTLMENYCKQFFTDVENIKNKKIINYIKNYDFSLLSNIREAGFLGHILSLTIDKFGIETLVKEIMPDCFEKEKINLVKKILLFFVYIFTGKKRDLKINTNNEFNIELNSLIETFKSTVDKGENYHTQQDFYNKNIFHLVGLLYNYNTRRDKLGTTSDTEQNTHNERSIENSLEVNAHNESVCSNFSLPMSSTYDDSASEYSDGTLVDLESLSNCSEKTVIDLENDVPKNESPQEPKKEEKESNHTPKFFKSIKKSFIGMFKSKNSEKLEPNVPNDLPAEDNINTPKVA